MNVKIRKMRPEEYSVPTQFMLEEDWALLDEEYSEMMQNKFPDLKTTLIAIDAESLEFFVFF